MKRHLVALGCLLMTCGCSHAQSKVELYGVVDAGVTRVSGIQGGSVTLLSSGIMEGSRIGLRGNEDLGGGYRAIFTLENRLEADTGDISNRPPSRGQLPDRATFARYLLPSLPAVQQTALQPLLNQVSAGIGTRIGINVHTAGPNFFDRQIYVGLVTPVGAVAGRPHVHTGLRTGGNLRCTRRAVVAGSGSDRGRFPMRSTSAAAMRWPTGSSRAAGPLR